MAEVRFWLPEGTIVGDRYRLDKVLGVGGYGITYKGTDTRLGRTVAIKEYYPRVWAMRYIERGLQVQCQRDREKSFAAGMDRFVDEAKTLVQLSHVPGVVRVHDYFEENGTAYIVMEFLDGKNLKQMADGFGGRIPADILIPVLSPVIVALRRVHEKGLIHRDLSPDNIMMLEDGSVCLIDFGNARDTTEDRSMTLAMKQGFAPPEAYYSHGQGTYSDVYALCATMYYCLTGKLPPQPMDRLTGAPFLAPSEMGVQIDPVWEKTILDGLELYAKKRIQTMDELWNRLYAVPSVEEEQSAVQKKSVQEEKTQEAPTEQSVAEAPVQCDAVPQNEVTKQENQVTEITAQIPRLPQRDEQLDRYMHALDSERSFEHKVSAGLQRIRDICAQIYRKMKEL